MKYLETYEKKYNFRTKKLRDNYDKLKIGDVIYTSWTWSPDIGVIFDFDKDFVNVINTRFEIKNISTKHVLENLNKNYYLYGIMEYIENNPDFLEFVSELLSKKWLRLIKLQDKWKDNDDLMINLEAPKYNL